MNAASASDGRGTISFTNQPHSMHLPDNAETAPQQGDSLELEMLPGEKWWGLATAFGRDMPFSEKTEFSIDLRRSSYSHQTQSLLCSDRGRAAWCPEPVLAEFSGGAIRLSSDAGKIGFEPHAGANLREAFRHAASAWLKPDGREPDLLFFSAPQYNTWIELTYHQNERDILAYAQSMLDAGLPPGVFMIDDTWQLDYGTWEFDPRRFGDPKGMVDKLHAMGFEVLLWTCPYVSMDSPAYRRIIGLHGRGPGGFLCARADDAGRPRAEWANDPAAVTWWNGKSALLDFTHPDARRWFSGELARLKRDYGVDGFKFDAGSVETYAKGFLAKDPSASAAAQSALYGAFALEDRTAEMRDCWGLAGKPVVMRLHDKPHTWEALARLVPDMLAAGMTGYPFICPDMIGGGEWSAFLPGSAFDPELFVRSAQIHALCPMMQISASPWRVLPPELQAVFKDVVALRQRFAPRFVALAKESARTGEPMMRPLEYVFPGAGLAEVRDEFLMGDDLLVAPVLEKGGAERRVAIPPGLWRDDLGAEFSGPATLVLRDVPLARLPHYEKIG